MKMDVWLPNVVYACGWTVLVCKCKQYTYVCLRIPPAYQSYTNRIPIVYQSYTNRIPIVYRIPIVHQSYTNRIPLYTTVYHRIPSYTVVYRYIRRYLHLHTNIVQPQAYTTFVSHTSIFNRYIFFFSDSASLHF